MACDARVVFPSIRLHHEPTRIVVGLGKSAQSGCYKQLAQQRQARRHLLHKEVDTSADLFADGFRIAGTESERHAVCATGHLLQVEALQPDPSGELSRSIDRRCHCRGRHEGWVQCLGFAGCNMLRADQAGGAARVAPPTHVRAPPVEHVPCTEPAEYGLTAHTLEGCPGRAPFPEGPDLARGVAVPHRDSHRRNAMSAPSGCNVHGRLELGQSAQAVGIRQRFQRPWTVFVG
mmetsp:Transcript_10960/g.36358  ORF Transcript_10960/g.36358 Transcript_10960/m.36358 type:complete len:233 (+) Transcript_10960:1841-2539(+)|eukprot:scaffold30033_cov101-Isochrysis_galbana.AAC.2